MKGPGKGNPGSRPGDRAAARLAVWIIPPLIFCVPFSRLVRFFDRGNGLPDPGHDPASDLELARWVDRTLRRMPWPWKRTCLKRVAVLYYLLRRQGRLVSMNVGVKRREDGKIHAHAWLTLDAAPYLEPDPRSLEGLRDIAVFPG